MKKIAIKETFVLVLEEREPENRQIPEADFLIVPAANINRATESKLWPHLQVTETIPAVYLAIADTDPQPLSGYIIPDSHIEDPIEVHSIISDYSSRQETETWFIERSMFYGEILERHSAKEVTLPRVAWSNSWATGYKFRKGSKD